MKSLTLEEFKKEKIAINPKTPEEYDNLMRFFNSVDITWGNKKKATKGNYFNEYENLCISYHINFCGVKECILYSNRYGEERKKHKIITPNELKEYNEFMTKPKYITTHAELLKLHGKSVTCKINGEYIDNAKIYVEDNFVYICQNAKKHSCIDGKFGYKYSYCLSRIEDTYEQNNEGCKEIKLKEETKYLTIGQAIDYMLESEENIIEYYHTKDEENKKVKVINKKIYHYYEENFGEKDIWMTSYGYDHFGKTILNGTNFKKYIEEPKKTLKELIEAKETFKYKEEWYRFNKDGAIIGSKGNAVSLEIIQEILTNKEHNG